MLSFYLMEFVKLTAFCDCDCKLLWNHSGINFIFLEFGISSMEFHLLEFGISNLEFHSLYSLTNLD
jgi:hypothetical protein